MLSKYLQEIKQEKSKSTHDTYYFILTPFEKWLRENKKDFYTCTKEDVLDYIAFRTDLSDISKRQILTAIKTFFKWYSTNALQIGITPEEIRNNLLDKQRIDKIVFLGVPNTIKGKKASERKELTREEYTNILELARGLDYDTIYLLLYFGLRKSELLSLRLKNVDFKSNKLTVVTSKTKEERILFFDDEVKIILNRSLLHIKNLLPHDLNNSFNRIGKDLNIKLYPHRTRHTFNSEMRDRINDDILLKKIMGHTVASDMTARYGGQIKFEEKIREAFLNKHYLKDGIE